MSNTLLRWFPRAAVLGVLAVSAVGSPAGCNCSPVSYSAPVGITLRVRSRDVVAGGITAGKNITTESGNPYGAFINAAQQRLNGQNPSTISLDAATLLLNNTSTGVTALEQVLTGRVEVHFVMNSSGTDYLAAHVDNPGGQSAACAVDFDSDLVVMSDWPQLMNGSFTVELRGPAAPGFATAGATADLELSFVFTAYR